MSGDVSDRKRLVAITKGNIAHSHVYLSGHHDFFPNEAYGQSNARDGKGKELTLMVDGFEDPVTTDIGVNGSNGKPCNFFRNRLIS